MQKYDKKIEEKMQLFYDNLSEKDKRHYAAVEAMKFGHGGIKYLANLFKCTRQTITKGLRELEENKEIVKVGRSRRLGGGRKGYEANHPNTDAIFFKGD
jgi:DNA invertase Pin-like site-specific DNA recombinase